MAAEVATMPGVNGYAPHSGYGGIEHQAYNPTPTSTHSAYPAPDSTTGSAASGQSEVPKDEVGWYFVEQYYTTLSRSPEKLYLFYNKRSQFVSGQETDKVPVCVGQRAINDRIKELDFHDCKVRVTNVDSQASDANIVIQVIGEISNQGKPHKKFTQTFVLATQTNGYFVLNDIFRYLIEEEDEPEQEVAAPNAEEEVQQVPAAESESQEPAPTAVEEPEPKTLTSSMDPSAVEQDAQTVDKQLEEKVLNSEEAPSAGVTNGEPEPEEAEVVPSEETLAAALTSQTEEPPTTAEVTQPTATAEESLQPEAPKDPSPSPAATPAQQAPPQPAAPPKPAAPKTWASLAASANRSVATPVAPATPAAPSASQKSQPRPQSQAPTPAAPATQPATPSAPAAQREEPASAASQDEWTAVGGSHNRQQSRAGSIPHHQQSEAQQGPQTRGYIKNVHENVDYNELKQHLESFGETMYFDIARQKNCAFVDYKTPDGYQAAVAANPHTIGSDRLFVEERRVRPGAAFQPRGAPFGGRGRGVPGQGAPRGRGDFQSRGGYAPRGARGGPAGAQRGRGGAGTPA